MLEPDDPELVEPMPAVGKVIEPDDAELVESETVEPEPAWLKLADLEYANTLECT